MAASRSYCLTEPCLDSPITYDSVAIVSGGGHAQSRQAAVLLRALFFLFGICLGGFALVPIQAQVAYFSGAVTTLDLSLQEPAGVALDARGNIYVTDLYSNAVYEIPSGCASASCVVTLGGGFYQPYGVAVDAAGNVYVADTDNAVLEKMTPGCVSSNCVTVVPGTSSGQFAPTSVALDAYGNLYFTSGHDVWEIPVGCASSGCFVNLAAPLTFTLFSPYGVTVDASGNVYVTDVDFGVYELSDCTSAGAQTCRLGGNFGFNSPYGVAVDPKGNVYVAAQGVYEMPPGCFSADCVTQVATGFGNPAIGLALDGSGDIFVADTNHAKVKEIQQSGVNFGSVAVGSTGNVITLNFNFTAADSGIITSVLTQGATGLDFIDAKTGSCDPLGSSYTSVPGTGCTVDVTFNPKYAGARYGAVQLSDATGVIATAYIYGTGQGPELAFDPGTINTIAGNGTQGYGGDGGAANNAELYVPEGVAIDGMGNLYIADTGNNRVRKVTASTGAITTIAGNGIERIGVGVGDGGLAVSAELYFPAGLAVDGAGNLYITDAFNNRIREVNASTGIITTVAGNGTAGFSGDGGPGSSAEVSTPFAIAVDGAGNLYIADAGNNRIRKLNVSTGVITTVAGNGTAGYSGDGGAATGAELYSPEGVAVDGAGNLYIADEFNNRIREVNASTGIITTVAGNGTLGYGGDGGTATNAELYNPLGLGLDSASNLYIADGDNRIREVNASTGIITTVASNGTEGYSGDGGPATSAEMDSSPSSVALDGAGNLYIADTYNQRIREVNVSAASLAFASTNVGSKSADSPQSVTVQNIGNAPLSFSVPVAGENPSISTNFSLDSTTTCPEVMTSSSPGTLPAGATCTLAIDFIPTTGGMISGEAVLSDNNLNVTSATQTINLGGSGLNSTVSVSIGTSPVGLSFSINGTPYNTTQTPSLNIGTQYILSTTSPQAGGPGVQYVFSQWSDGTTSLTDLLTPTAATSSDTAQFTAQYMLTVTAGLGGTIAASTAPNGFYNPATLQPIAATPNAGYYFVGWTGANSPGDFGSATSASTSVTMNGPENLTANFAPIPTFQVTTLNDDATGNAANCTTPSPNCSLRDAITAIEANNGSTGNISFAPGLDGTITLTSALPPLIGQMTITGPGAGNLTISGGNSQTVGSVFTVNSGATVDFYGVSIANGNADNYYGGGIINYGTLTVNNSTFSRNAAFYGSGIASFGTLTVNGSTFSNNGNGQPGWGGGIYNVGILRVSSSTFSDNEVFYIGGGIYNGGTTTVTNSTFSGNVAVEFAGGAIYNANMLTIANSTISGNTSTYGGGISNGRYGQTTLGTLMITNSIVAGNSSYYTYDCDSCGTQSSYNLIVETFQPINPMLAQLASNGGSTQTMLPLPGSAAICAASSALIPTGVTTDQRGFPDSTTYNSTTCYDLGAVQTNYSLSFTTEPPSAGTIAGTAMSPAPAVTVTESGSALTGGSASVNVTDPNSDLTTNPTTATTSTANGKAAFNNLLFTGATNNDTLTAALALSPNNTGLNLTTSSTSFSVVSPVVVTIGTSPTGLSFSINGMPYTKTQTPSLIVGDLYTLATTTPQAGGPGVQYVFSQWSDGTMTLTDLLTPTASTSSDTAQFTAQYMLTVTAGLGGTIAASTAPNGFYNPATLQPIAATPNAGYYFVGWTGANSPGDIGSATSASTSVTMNGPENLTANFAPIPTFQVTTLNDDATGNAANCTTPSPNCSLRDAITAVQSINGSTGNITFASGLNGTITLTSALPILIGQMTITGPGASSLTISGGNSQAVGSVFTLNPGATVGLSGITITDGNSVNGGAITNNGSLTVTNSTLSGNTGGCGGAICNLIGVAQSASAGNLTLIDSTISGNHANFNGGAIVNSGALIVVDSTISGNSASYVYGGGIYNANGTLTVANSTISGNVSGQYGGGIFNSSTVTISNSIVAGNTSSGNAGDDCDRCGTQSNYNLISTPGNIINPNLAALGNYSGPTQTMLPLPGSAAICAASSALIPAGITTDQRGFTNYTTYNNTTCYDLGAVKTNYGLSFGTTQEPPSTGTLPSLTMSPAPAVTLTENGNPLTAGSASVNVTDANSDLTTSPATATTSASNGQAAFSTLIFTGPTSGDTLIASLALNSTNAGLNLTATSTSFSVAAGTPSVIWPTASAITYGQTLGSSTLSGGSASFGNTSVLGSFAFSNPSTVPGAGTQTENITFTPSSTSAYNSVSGTINVLVNKAMPTVTFTGAPANAPYGATFMVAATTNASTTAVITASGACSITGTTVTITAPSGACSLTATWAADNNYMAASATQSTIATKATPLITWATPTAIAYGTALSATQLDATATYNGAAVAGKFVYTPTKGTVLAAGSQTLSATFTPTNTTDYASASASVTLQVNQATPKITWAKPAAITYGTALSSTQLDATTTVAGTLVYSPAAGTVLDAGTQTLSVSFTPTDMVDYTTAADSVTITVTKATVVISWATPSPIVYGIALSNTQLDATASVPGTFAYSPALGTIEPAGADKLSVTFTPTDKVDYSTATTSVTLQVNAATPVINWSTPAAITYGTALSGTQLNATATNAGVTVAGTFAYTPAKGTVVGAGSQTLSATFTPTNTTNFTSASASVVLQVNQVAPKITWAKPAAITYGTALSNTQLDASASVPGTFVYSPPLGRILPGGSQTLTATFSPTDSVDYTTATDSVSITVNPTTSTTTITSNTPNPSVEGQSVTVSFAVSGDNGVPTGTVKVTASTGQSCSGTLSGGTGSCALTFTAPGSPNLTAVYSGDASFKASTSVKVAQTVQP